MNPKISTFLRKIRKEHKIKVKDLAKIFNCAPCTITSMEYGHRKIGELWARRFAEFFNVQDWQKFLTEGNK